MGVLSKNADDVEGVSDKILTLLTLGGGGGKKLGHTAEIKKMIKTSCLLASG